MGNNSSSRYVDNTSGVPETEGKDGGANSDPPRVTTPQRTKDSRDTTPQRSKSPTNRSPSGSCKSKKQDEQGFDLTNAQITMLQRLWQKARNQGVEEPCHSILTSVFLKAPEVEQVFLRVEKHCQEKKYGSGSCPAISVGESPPMMLTHKECVRRHAGLITTTIDNVMANLATVDGITPILQEVGRKHTRFREHGFHPRYWNIFAEAMIQRTLLWGTRNQRNGATYQGWSQIVTYIVQALRIGYNQGLIEERRQKSVTAPSIVVQSSHSVDAKEHASDGEEPGPKRHMIKSHSMEAPHTDLLEGRPPSGPQYSNQSYLRVEWSRHRHVSFDDS